MASSDHLHAETSILPVDTGLRLLCRQYLLGASRHNHPASAAAFADPGPRAMKRTLGSMFSKDIEHLRGDVQSPAGYRRGLRALHSTAVREALGCQGPNRLLGRPAPPISDSERELPRPYRTALSQLRSGFCSRLSDYKLRIGQVDDATCPECGTAEQTVEHLFDCASFPTDLRPEHLWSEPVRVSHFLSSLPSFDYLPPLDRPPPEPPPNGRRGS